MKHERRALIFANGETLGNELSVSLREVGLQPLRPHELVSNSGRVAIVILDRPAPNTVAICTNLRKQSEFSSAPILALVEGADPGQLAQLNSLEVDLFFKPVGVVALSRYLQTKVSAHIEETDDTSNAIPEAASDEVATLSLERTQSIEAERANANTVVAPLPDLIPTSNRLLPRVPGHVSVAKGGVPCARCGRWKARREDSFCSRCGCSLAALTAPASLVFEPFGEHRIGGLVELKNDGQNPLRMHFSLPSKGQFERRFDLHTGEALLEGGHIKDLLVTFDARGLDLSTRYQTALEITSNEAGLSKRQVQLVVERLPIARIVAEQQLVFVIGAENQWDVRLSNDGGGTLRLSRVVLEQVGEEQLTSELELVEPVHVKGGQSVAVSLRVPALDLASGTHQMRVICEFEHLAPAAVDLIVEAVRPARLAVQPPELDFGVVSTRRTRHSSLTLVNGGGEELSIESIKPSVDWMECLVQTPLQIGPGSTRVFDIVVHGSVEVAGNHSGEIEIRSSSYQSPTQLIPFLVKFVEPANYEEYIGIDFGTTASCIAVLDKYDLPFALTLDTVEPGSQSDTRIIPSVLFFQEDGTVLAGREALNEAAIRPNNAVTSIKRVLGRNHKVKLAGREYSATELTSKVIEQLILRTEDSLFELGEYKTPRRAVVTVPVEFYDNQRRALLEACEMAGLETHTSSHQGIVIDEAHAAALYYLSRKVQIAEVDKPERLLIFDFGGGTLDCALIEIESIDGKILFKTLAPGGDPRLGGEDIDWALVGLLADKTREVHAEFDLNCLGDEQKFGHNYRTPVLAEAAYRTRARFKRQAEAAKISLVDSSAVELSLQPLLRLGATPLEPFILNGQRLASCDVTLTKEELENAITPFLQRAAEVVVTVCQRANLLPEEVHTILHVGRTSLLPMVREHINALLPNAQDRSDLVMPKLCVALGAAFWGYIKDQPNANIEFIGGANRTIHDIGYVDTPVSSGMLRQVFVPVFPAQTEFPCEKLVELPRNREWINLQLAENRGKKLLLEGNPEIKKIGKVRIDARGLTGPTLAVRFAINENRVLEITANEQTQTIEMMEE